MLRMSTIVILLLSLNGAVSAKSYSQIFNDIIASDEVQNLSVNTNSIQKSQEYNFVFVGGFLNEISYGYFKDNESFLKDLKIPKKQIHKIFPSSSVAVEKNIPWLAKNLLEKFNSNKKPLVIISHSKGAAETLGVILKYPLILKKIHKVFLVQAAVRGSHVADYMMGVGRKLDEKMVWHRRFEMDFKKSANVTIPQLVNQGISSLSHSAMTNLWNKLAKGRRDEFKEKLKNKVFYIGSHEQLDGISKSITASGLYLSTYYGASDGLIMANEYYIDDLGTRLGLFENIDHMDLFLGFPYSNGSIRLRQKFTMALLKLALGLNSSKIPSL